MFQDINLYAFNVAENVSMHYDKDVNIDKVQNALRLSGLDTKVNKLTKGIKTVLSKELEDDGTDLSGGKAKVSFSSSYL